MNAASKLRQNRFKYRATAEYSSEGFLVDRYL